MDFRILGQLEVAQGRELINIGGPRQQTVLAMLLLEPDKVIPLTRLIDAMWNGEPPATARAQVQICVSGLRRTLMAAGGDIIGTRSPGYLLRLEGSSLDLHDFETIAASGRQALGAGDPALAAAGFRHALSLWRGPALSNVSSSLVQNSVAHLNERRLAVLEECLEAELSIGQPRDVIDELMKLANEYPLRERFRALLMIALHRASRQAEALEVYRATHATLASELGIEPGSELRELHQRILSGEPVTGPSPPAPAAAGSPRPAVAVPRLLPAAIPDFTGRTRLASAIVTTVSAAAADREAGYAVPVNVIFGEGGVGKTTLAIHVAHQVAAQFPGGQLFARLRAGDRQVDPADVLGRFLRALGMQGSSLPDDIEERAEIYRNLLGQRRILVVLDDAVSQQQIAPLLPGSSSCSVIVTSRQRLTGLPVANRYEVGVFSRRTAVELLTRIVGGPRIEAEPDAVSELCELCGYLPLATRIVAARLAARPHWTVAGLVGRLVNESHRLDELSYGEMGVRTSIAVSFESLSPDARCLFRRLALSGAPSFAPWTGSPLLETDALHAADLLEELAEAYLIDREQGPATEPVRYRFHDMTRPFAQERMRVEESPQERRAALERYAGALLFLATEAHCREYSGNYLHLTSHASHWPLPAKLTGQLLADPLAWYEQERLSIVAGVRQAAAAGMVEHSWDLALCAVTLFEARAYFSDWRETHEIALRAACRAGDLRGEAAMRYSLGSLHLFQQQSGQAMRQFERAWRLYKELGDQHGAALVLRNMAILDRRDGRLEQALARSEEALGVFQLVGDRVAEAHVLHNMAQVRLDYGDDGLAGDLLDRAARICTQTGNRRVYAQVQYQLGNLRLRGGNLDGAVAGFSSALSIAREAQDRIGECYGLAGLAQAEIGRGRLELARRLLAGALETAGGTGDMLVESRVALALAAAELACGQLQAAAGHTEQALHNCEYMDASPVTAQALVLRGKIHRAAGETAEARQAWERAAALMSTMELRGAVMLSAELANLQDRLRLDCGEQAVRTRPRDRHQIGAGAHGQGGS